MFNELLQGLLPECSKCCRNFISKQRTNKTNKTKETVKTQTRYNRIIKDAKNDLLIRVKPEDIRGAVCKDHAKCVVAKAITRQRKSSVKWVDVGNSVVLIGSSKTTGRRYHLPRQAQKQIRFFDENDGRFAPCAVQLKAPAVGNRALGDREGEGHSGGHKRGPNKNQPTR